METTNLEKLVQSLLQEVSLLTVPTKAAAIQRFNKDFLTSEMRIKAYEKFDGIKTLTEISQEIGCKINTLQVFVAQLIENNLVDVTKQGNNKLISKSITKIAVYYATKDLQKEENVNG